MKKMNKKGFTLIELLAVIVILAILVAVSIPAVTKYLATARSGTFASNASAAISVVRNDVITNGALDGTEYDLDDINVLLEKKLITSPYSKAYNPNSKIIVNVTADGNVTYSIILVDASGNGLFTCTSNTVGGVAEGNVTKENVKTGTAVATIASNNGAISCVTP